MSVRKLLLVALVVLAAAAPAFANGPSGSTESNNQVNCTGSPVAGAYLYVGTKGVEACSEGGLVIEGRVIVSAEKGYASIDGDESDKGMSNSLAGFLRADAGGLHCDDGDYSTKANKDSTAPSPAWHSGAQCVKDLAGI